MKRTKLENIKTKEKFYFIFTNNHPLKGFYGVIFANDYHFAKHAIGKTFTPGYKVHRTEEMKSILDQTKTKITRLNLLVIFEADVYNVKTITDCEVIDEMILNIHEELK